MGRPVDKEKRKKAARAVIRRALDDGRKLKGLKGLRELLEEETEEMDYPIEYFSALSDADLAGLVCEAVDIARPSPISSSPYPPAPMAPQVDGATLGVASTLGPNTQVGPGNTLTPAPSQQDGRSEGLKGPGQSDVDIEEAA